MNLSVESKRVVMPIFWVVAVALGYAVTRSQTLVTTAAAAAALLVLAYAIKPGTLLMYVAVMIPFRAIEAYVPITRGGVTMADAFLIAFVASSLLRTRVFRGRRVSAALAAVLVVFVVIATVSAFNGGFLGVGIRKISRMVTISLALLGAMRSLGYADARRVAKTFVLAGALSSVVALAFTVRSIGVPGVDMLRLWGGVEDPNHMAVVLGVAFIIALAWRPRDVPGGIWTGAALLLLVAQAASLSRGGAAAFGGGLLIMLMLAVWARSAGRRLGVFSRSGGALVLLAVIAAFASAYLPSDLTGTAVQRYQGLLTPQSDATGAFRIRLWEAGSRLLANSPLLGVGPGAFGLALVATGAFSTPWEAHSSIVEIAVETGYLGAGTMTLALLLGALMSVRGFARTLREETFSTQRVALVCGLMGGAGGVVVGSASLSNILYHPLFAMVLALLVATLSSQELVDPAGGELVEPKPSGGLGPHG